MCAGAWITECICAGQYAAVLFVWTFRIEHTQALGWHTIDAPVNIALIVANCYRETAIICTNQIDHKPRLTSDCQCFFLTCICRVIFGRYFKFERKKRREEKKTLENFRSGVLENVHLSHVWENIFWERMRFRKNKEGSKDTNKEQ